MRKRMSIVIIAALVIVAAVMYFRAPVLERSEFRRPEDDIAARVAEIRAKFPPPDHTVPDVNVDIEILRKGFTAADKYYKSLEDIVQDVRRERKKNPSALDPTDSANMLRDHYARAFADSVYARAEAGMGTIEDLDDAGNFLATAGIIYTVPDGLGLVPFVKLQKYAADALGRWLTPDTMRELKGGNPEVLNKLEKSLKKYNLEPSDVGLTEEQMKRFRAARDHPQPPDPPI